VVFPSCAELPLPHYEELVLCAPSLLDVVEFLHRYDATAIHASTPGPMGVVALLAARLLQLPIAATYHTDVPNYARILTGRLLAGEVSWLYILGFYRLVDEVLVPSASSRRQLVARGLPAERIAPLPRWVDSELFTPSRRDLGLWPRLGVGPGLKLLFVGRLSREKNLELLAGAFEDLIATGYAVRLVLAGDGPYRQILQARLQGLPATFLGFVPHADFPAIYASADLFVFPSATDTFGNVVLEAQAAGLPVVVSDSGGPAELVQDGNTGVVVHANDRRALVGAIRSLLDDPGRLALMSVQARRFVLANQIPVERQFETLLRGPRQTRRGLWRRSPGSEPELV
jgi:glycosyltransferase involved in cell wall biosynthesis